MMIELDIRFIKMYDRSMINDFMGEILGNVFTVTIIHPNILVTVEEKYFTDEKSAMKFANSEIDGLYLFEVKKNGRLLRHYDSIFSYDWIED